MAKKLTHSKIKSILNENKKLLSRKSDNEQQNITILLQYEKILLDSILDNESLPEKNKNTTAKATNHSDKSSFLVKTNPSERTKRGTFILTKQDSQKMDSFRGNII